MKYNRFFSHPIFLWGAMFILVLGIASFARGCLSEQRVRYMELQDEEQKTSILSESL